MPSPEEAQSSWEDHGAFSEKLKSSLDQLIQKKVEESGLSSNFQKKLHEQKVAMEICEEAMANLAVDYVDALEQYRYSPDSNKCLEELELAEGIWRENSGHIQTLDRDGEESAFLLEVRENAFAVLENKLMDLAKNTKPSEEDVALCLGTLGVMDHILGEFGHPRDSTRRIELSEIAKTLA